MAAGLGALGVLTPFAAIPLMVEIHQTSVVDSTSTAIYMVFAIVFAAVGTVVARRDSRNPIGWLLLFASLAVTVGSDAPVYAFLDYAKDHRSLPLGPVALLLGQSYVYGFMALPLIVLLFPDGRAGARWRWPLRAYLVAAAVYIAGTVSVAAVALGQRTPVYGNGNLIGENHPFGAAAWFGDVKAAITLVFAVFCVASIARQVVAFRGASGERRQQLKWLGAGGALSVVFLLVVVFWTSAPAVLGNVMLPLAMSALPLSIGVGILKFRLYEIDRLVSRTLSYALLTALLVGMFIGLIALSTDTLALSGRVGVAASTLAAAALFNPLRIRIQRLVDRRFNRARYDAEATVVAFTARLRDAVDIEAIRSDLLDAVNHAVEPSHASIWIRS
ncbi:MAG TPA: hypothetical protein VHX66_15165 [Solirubrobacteraceae bacterium]|nr:hypothetical protein [Solirubrobacteraceae bacterium]